MAETKFPVGWLKYPVVGSKFLVGGYFEKKYFSRLWLGIYPGMILVAEKCSDHRYFRGNFATTVKSGSTIWAILALAATLRNM